jgi:hypothetical protein
MRLLLTFANSDRKQVRLLGPLDQDWAAKNGGYMRYIKLFSILFFLSSSFSLPAYAESPFLVSSQQLIDLKERQGVLFKQPNGPFAAMLFNEFAQGIHIGIIYHQQMGVPVDGNWWISYRFWQEKPWNADITSFAWDESGKYLYIGTSEVYGDGGLFKLDLYKKTFVKLYPKPKVDLEPALSTEIIELNQTNGKLKVKLILVDETTKIVVIPIE